MKIKIVSGGTAHTTEILDELGNRLEGVVSVEIRRIDNSSGMVTARIEFENLQLDVEALAE